MEQMPTILIKVPAKLHPDSIKLVKDFAEQLALKLRDAEVHYGYQNEWKDHLGFNEVECQKAMYEHIIKGDPRDVAIYCAFMWYHSWSTMSAFHEIKLNAPERKVDVIRFKAIVDGKGVL